MTAVASGKPASLPRRAAHFIARCAVTAIIAELETWPKPGLVSHIDAGSHIDMDASLFCASAAAIEPYLEALAMAGSETAPMDELRRIGLEAEDAMLAATGGINTHRGAIFALGLLCAAAGKASTTSHSAASLGTIVRCYWGPAIMRGPIPLHSHGTQALLHYGVGGARAQAAAGFPALFETGLPALRLGRRLAPGDEEAARLQAFFALLAITEDTNLLHRGGAEGLSYAQQAASHFLQNGGVGNATWREIALAVHRAFIARRLSPGGCADLLAASLFIDAWEAAQ